METEWSVTIRFFAAKKQKVFFCYCINLMGCTVEFIFLFAWAKRIRRAQVRRNGRRKLEYWRKITAREIEFLVLRRSDAIKNLLGNYRPTKLRSIRTVLMFLKFFFISNW